MKYIAIICYLLAMYVAFNDYKKEKISRKNFVLVVTLLIILLLIVL